MKLRSQRQGPPDEVPLTPFCAISGSARGRLVRPSTTEYGRRGDHFQDRATG
ncbi:hypothetical protein [Streptosporangium sp. KLBMP 9127]|nr:hypothetical protein [Streptosporangium sp. KLBMP 9127]